GLVLRFSGLALRFSGLVLRLSGLALRCYRSFLRCWQQHLGQRRPAQPARFDFLVHTFPAHQSEPQHPADEASLAILGYGFILPLLQAEASPLATERIKPEIFRHAQEILINFFLLAFVLGRGTLR